MRKKIFENIVGKGENVGNQHFLFPQCFLPFEKQFSIFPLHHTIRLLTTLRKKIFENIVGKEKMLVTSIFSFLPRCCLTLQKRFSILQSCLFCHPPMLIIWTWPKFYSIICRKFQDIKKFRPMSLKPVRADMGHGSILLAYAISPFPPQSLTHTIQVDNVNSSSPSLDSEHTVSYSAS